jgi:hypothetical protein
MKDGSREQVLESSAAHTNRLPDRLVALSAFHLVLILALGCQSTRPGGREGPADPSWFRDVSAEVGLDFRHDAGPVGSYFVPQILGSGAALFDFDKDGRLDIFLLQNGGPNSRSTNRLYHQEADGHFRDVSAGSGLDIAGWNMGAAVGDVNNDGWPDVLVTQYSGVKLFLNNKNGTFTDITQEAGLDNPLWGTSAAFLDYDRDGWLDLVVVNYLDYDRSRQCAAASGQPDYCYPQLFPGTVTKLFHNEGDRRAPCFTDRTLESGLGKLPGPGLGVVCADFDGDGWPDIFVANDGRPNHLWINQRDGTFQEEAIARGVAYNGMGQAQGNMGVALGDVDGDGLFDLFVTHLTEETNTLWRQGPRGVFRDRTPATGLASPRWRGTGFGTVLVDFDQDGALDLALVNGRVSRGKPAEETVLGPFWSVYAERNQFFRGDGRGKFRDLSTSTEPFCAQAAIGRALAWGDIDGDGAPDLLVTQVAGPARLYRNVAPRRGHGLLVRAVDPSLGGRDAYGAEITVESGGHRWVRWINPGQSYLCSSDPRAHFGLGEAERVDALRVRWPDGAAEVFAGRPADQPVTLRKGEGKADKETRR